MRNPFWLFLFALSCKDAGGTVDTDTDTDADTDTDTDSDSDSDTDSDTDPDTDVTTDFCWVPNGSGGTCYDTTICPLPTTPEPGSLKFLNQCTTADSSAFDNAARIPASTWVPGTPLPSIP